MSFLPSQLYKNENIITAPHFLFFYINEVNINRPIKLICVEHNDFYCFHFNHKYIILLEM